MKNQLTLIVIFVMLLAIAGFIYGSNHTSKYEKVSSLGHYQGYTTATYDGSHRASDYLTLSNGTRLAYDLILPTRDGTPTSVPLPVLFKYTPYLRTFTIFDENGKNIMSDLYQINAVEKVMLRMRYWVYDRGHLMDPLFRTKWLENMVHHGYAVVVVERPGTGASFGIMDPSFEAGAREADEILDWIAGQDWSDGHIGMFGDSWQAQIQFAAAGTGNPHLKAIFPVSGSLDNYNAVIYPGGVFNATFGELFSQLNSMLETLVTPVDADSDGTLLAQAIAERKGSTVGEASSQVFEKYPYRDTRNSHQEKVWEDVFALYPMLEEINQSNIPVYLVNGWFDLFPKDMFLWYTNLNVPKRLLVLPNDHSEMEEGNTDFDLGVEAHRWFDYWLKGIDNGIMDGPPVSYYLMGTSKAHAWQTTDQWPPIQHTQTSYYFAEGRSGSVRSINDGILEEKAPVSPGDQAKYMVDYTTSTGPLSRWFAVNDPRHYPDMRANDEKALTFTTNTLDADLRVVGHPIVHIWLKTSAPDLDIFVYLEEVDARGHSTYITEGVLRASHRTQSQPPFDNLGLPYFEHYESDLAFIPPDEPFAVDFDLLPTAYTFHKDARIRVTVAFADKDNFATPVIVPAPEVNVLHDSAYPSFIELPTVALH